jgi:hypothetical protein
MPRLTPDARQAANVDAYKAALSAFWGNMTALEQIVEEDFPDGANETIAPTRYQVDAIRDLGNRVGALVEGYSLPFLSSGATGRPLPTLLARQVAAQRRLAGCQR